jgi:hypothetical protein
MSNEQDRNLASDLRNRDEDIARQQELLEAERHAGQLMFLEQQRWQEMAEDLWEELQEWHYDECETQRQPGCICHRILATKWDELTPRRRVRRRRRGAGMSIEQDRRTVEAWQAIVNDTDRPVITLSRATLRCIVDIAAQAVVKANP